MKIKVQICMLLKNVSGYLSFKSHDVLKEIELVYIVISAILRGEQKRTKKSKQIHKALVGISVYSVVSVINNKNNKQTNKYTKFQSTKMEKKSK